jgi:hypothetical protein
LWKREFQAIGNLREETDTVFIAEKYTYIDFRAGLLKEIVATE